MARRDSQNLALLNPTDAEHPAFGGSGIEFENQINFLKASGKLNYNMGLIELTKHFYLDSQGDYAKKKFQIFRKDFFSWFVTLNLEKQTRYIELVNQTG